MRSILAFVTLAAAKAIPSNTSQVDIELSSSDGQAYSPPHYPSPWMNPEAPGWEQAYSRAKDFVSQLTLLEKVNLTTGVG